MTGREYGTDLVNQRQHPSESVYFMIFTEVRENLGFSGQEEDVYVRTLLLIVRKSRQHGVV